MRPRPAWPLNECSLDDGERFVSTQQGPKLAVLPATTGETSSGRPIVLQPAGWPMPKGYANGMAAEGRLVATGGVVCWGNDRPFSAEFLGPGRTMLPHNVALPTVRGAGAPPPGCPTRVCRAL